MTEINKNSESVSVVKDSSSKSSKEKAPVSSNSKGDNRKFNKRSFKRKSKKDSSDTPDMFERVIKINRVMKVCKGGKRLGFRAVAVVGDLNGKVGIGLGKSNEVPGAIKKAIERAKKSLQTVDVLNGTIAHKVYGRFGSAAVIINPAPEGTGIIAGGSTRSILEAAGVRNAVAKSKGSSNAINSARASLNGLSQLMNESIESERRGVTLRIRKYAESEAL